MGPLCRSHPAPRRRSDAAHGLLIHGRAGSSGTGLEAAIFDGRLSLSLPQPANTDLPLIASVEAEAALLGAMMQFNDTIDRVADRLKPEDFAEALHSRIYS